MENPKPARVVIGRLVKRGDEEAFNREFWHNQGAEARFAAAWEMVCEVELFRGNNASESRLQRSVQNIKRRSR
jgi:hypothetical protein